MTSELNFSVPGKVLSSPLCLNHACVGDIVQALSLIHPPGDSLQLWGCFVLESHSLLLILCLGINNLWGLRNWPLVLLGILQFV